jgi:hypothetical protein
VVVGDFDGDGKPDLAVANAGSGSTVSPSISVLRGNGDGTFQPPQHVFSSVSPGPMAVGDFDSNGTSDLAVANGNSVSILLGNHDGTFQPAQNFAVGLTANSLGVGDFNGDGAPDLAVAGYNSSFSGCVSVLLGNGHGSFHLSGQNLALGFTPGGTPAVGDFNGDGTPDLVLTSNNNTLTLILGNGDGTFQAAQSFSIAPPFQNLYTDGVATGDFNGDGKADLSVTHAGPGTVSVLLGNGNGTFQAPQNFAASPSPSAAALGDFDGDGTPDVALASGDISLDLNHGINVLLGNGNGTFGPVHNFPAGIDFESVVVGDFNGDGKPDLAALRNDTNSATYTVSVLLNQPLPTTMLSGPANSDYPQAVTYTATVTYDGAAVTAGTVTFLDGNTPLSAALPLDANGQATFSIATLNAGSHTITASYSGTPGGPGNTGLGPNMASASLMVNGLPLSASAINFSATAGAPWSGAVATFTNPDPYGSAASYTALIDWGDGTTSVGTITGTDTLTVSGSHTYADPGIDAVTVQISHILGDTTTATVYPTATVVNLGQSVQHGLTGGVGFWHSKNGQALLDNFNGGPDATALSSWLAAAFPNLYGAGAGANNLSGLGNAQVAAFYQSRFALPGSNLEAEVLATALNVYATTQSLGGSIGQTYGFSVTTTGLGADSINVGADGSAFGVANNVTRNVYELLRGVDQQVVLGTLYDGDNTLSKEANDLFDALNKAGAIG